MAHYSRLSKIVIDVPPADHDRELAFWNAATGQPLTQFTRHPEYHGTMLPGQDIGLLIQRAGQAHHWQLMRDPAGLVFCVIPEPPGELDASNARRWD